MSCEYLPFFFFGGFHLLHLYSQRDGDVQWDVYSIFETNLALSV